MEQRTGTSAQLAEGNLALRLEELRRAAGLSQEALSRRMSEEGVPMPQSAISRIEKPGHSGRRAITVDEALALSRVFKMQLDELLQSPDADLLGRLRNAVWQQDLLEATEVVRDQLIADVIDRATPSEWWQEKVAQEAAQAYKESQRSTGHRGDGAGWRFYSLLLRRFASLEPKVRQPSLQRWLDVATEARADG